LLVVQVGADKAVKVVEAEGLVDTVPLTEHQVIIHLLVAKLP
jgi:hypothetical protein